ncbi:MAG: D-sedoheptulose 7-phosphate isomerase [Bacteroidota bacterium]|nr:D-sedoheptulose 7-phosphate isomerase [Bacteroidota bacterium]
MSDQNTAKSFIEIISSNLNEAKMILENFIQLPDTLYTISAVADLMSTALMSGNKLISCGNGGSMCDAMHFAEELSGRFRENRMAIPAICISDASYISCVANDFGYDQVFSRFIEAFGRENDVLLAISTSGTSANVVLAAERAKEKGMKVVALTGKDGGKLGKIADIEVRAPKSDYADRAQEIHIKVIHSLINCIEEVVCLPENFTQAEASNANNK